MIPLNRRQKALLGMTAMPFGVVRADIDNARWKALARLSKRGLCRLGWVASRGPAAFITPAGREALSSLQEGSA